MIGLEFWYYYGMLTLGGWILFLLISIIVAIWIWYDSLSRNITAWGWRITALFLPALFLPTMILRFTVSQVDLTSYVACINTPPNTADVCVRIACSGGACPPMTPYYEIIFYIGLLAGLLSLGMAVAYFFKFQDYVEERESVRPLPPPPPPQRQYRPQPQPQPRREREPYPAEPARPNKPAAQAWLASQDGRSHQLYLGETTIGRSAQNDIYISGDTTISKRQAKIMEQNGHFKLIDLGSTNGTQVNGRWVRQPVLLEADDEVQFGDHTVMQFITARR